MTLIIALCLVVYILGFLSPLLIASYAVGRMESEEEREERRNLHYDPPVYARTNVFRGTEKTEI